MRNPIHEAVVPTPTGIAWHGDDLVCAAERGRGWTRIALADEPVLCAPEDAAALSLRTVEHRWERFATCHCAGEDGRENRHGAVEDGINRVAIAPDPVGRGFVIAVGFNAPEQRELVCHLAAGVRVRQPGPDPSAAPLCDPGAAPWSFPAGVVAITPTGRTLWIDHACRSEPAADGGAHLVIACAGFTGNRIACRYDPRPRPEWLFDAPGVALTGEVDVPHHHADDVHPVHGTVVHTSDAPPAVVLRLTWHGTAPLACRGELAVRSCLAETGPGRTRPVELQPGENTVDFGALVPATPGIHECQVALTDRDGRLLWTDRFRVAWDVDRFRPAVQPPEDLDAFWAETLAELRSRPLDPDLRRADAGENPDWRFWELTITSLGGQRVHCLISEPTAAPRPLPVLVQSHPGAQGWGANRGPDGVFGSEIKADPRFLTITPLVRGYGIDEPDIPFNHPWWSPLDADREAYAARAWYCHMVRVVDYLATRGDLIDMHRVVANGGSQGGALAIALAALEPRIRLCLADAPSNAMLHELIAGRYSGFGPQPGQVDPARGVAATARMLGYFDPANLAPRVRCPTHIGFNVGDPTVHANGGLGIWANLTGLEPAQRPLYLGSLITHRGPRSLGEAREALYAAIAAEAPPAG